MWEWKYTYNFGINASAVLFHFTYIAITRYNYVVNTEQINIVLIVRQNISNRFMTYCQENYDTIDPIRRQSYLDRQA